MSSRQAPAGDFDTDLTQLLPRLRVYALLLTRDSVRADDLVPRFVPPGHQLAGLTVPHPAQRVSLGPAPPAADHRAERSPYQQDVVPAATGERHDMREFKKAFRNLAGNQRRARLLSVLEGHAHRRSPVLPASRPAR
jgi:RNA polymerase sigma-70 factor, ECF subfamily